MDSHSPQKEENITSDNDNIASVNTEIFTDIEEISSKIGMEETEKILMKCEFFNHFLKCRIAFYHGQYTRRQLPADLIHQSCPNHHNINRKKSYSFDPQYSIPFDPNTSGVKRTWNCGFCVRFIFLLKLSIT